MDPRRSYPPSRHSTWRWPWVALLSLVLPLSSCAGGSPSGADVPGSDLAVTDASGDVPDAALFDAVDAVDPGPAAVDAGPDAVDAGLDASDAGPDAADVPPGLPPFFPAGWIRAIEEVGTTGVTRTSLNVAFLAAPFPTSQRVVRTEGDCTLLEGALPGYCQPACPSDRMCIDDACVPIPAPAPPGAISVTGLAVPITLDPDANGSYPVPTLPGDLFAAGAEVRATSTGGATPAFDLAARGVPDLVTDVDDGVFVSGEDYVVTWSPPAVPVPGARIRLAIETGWHGSTRFTTLWCETEDDGLLVVPSSLTALVQVPSCGKCERSTLQRFTRDVVDFGSGPIVLEVRSQWGFIPWW